jgi:hypothetical protein
MATVETIQKKRRGRPRKSLDVDGQLDLRHQMNENEEGTCNNI